MAITIIVAIVAVAVALLIAVPITCKVAVNNKVQKDAEVVGTAEDRARSIIDEALKTAETKKREALLEVKEESLRTKNELEKETKERRSELQKYERRVLSKEESVDKKADAVEKREAECTAKVAELQKREKKVDELEQKGVQELERISGLTSDQAKDELLRSVEDDVKVDVARLYKELESRAKEEAGKKAKEYVVNAIQKCAVDHVSETTISVVQLPSDEMKGRIIGREGRNIRTLETLTGVDLIIDDTPEAVVLSAFDPIRREIARVALEKLIVDGRIHPARIEEMVEKAQKEVEAQIREDGENAAMDVGVHGIHPELLKLLGRMKFRTSYGQNALKHSIEGAQLSGLGTQLSQGVNGMSTLFTQMEEQLPVMLEGVKQLQAGSDQLTTANTKLQSGYESLAKASTEQMISGADTLLKSGQTLTDGITTLQGKNNANANALLKGAKTLKGARKTLTSGISQISSATGQLVSGVGTLASNSGALTSGASQLSANSSSLNSGASQLASGADTLANGTGTLASGTKTLKSGTSSLVSGYTEGWC